MKERKENNCMKRNRTERNEKHWKKVTTKGKKVKIQDMKKKQGGWYDRKSRE